MIFPNCRLFFIILIIVLFSANAHALRLKIATISPEGSMWTEKMHKGAEQVAKETQNRVSFKFYTGGVMGNDKAVLRKIRIGQLHGGAVVGGSLSKFFPANQIYAQPMKFKNLDEVDYIREHIDSYIIDGLDQAGFVTFGLTGGGFAYLMSQEPIETISDLRAQKMWIPDNNQISEEAIQAFGISPIPLPIADVRTALQSGLINAVGTSPVGAIVLQWHTQIKYVTNMPLIHLHAVLAINKKYFSKIAAEDRKIVSRIMTRTMKDIETQNRLDDIKAIEALKNQGITFIDPPEAALEEWYRTAEIASLKMIESGILPQDIASKVDALLEEFHSKKQTGHAQ